MMPRLLLVLALAGVLAVIAATPTDSGDSRDSADSGDCDDDDDCPKDYTCAIKVDEDESDDDDCEVSAFFEGTRYCCDDDDDVVSFTFNFESAKKESGEKPFAEMIKEIVNCRCIVSKERDLGDKISDAFEDVKESAGKRWKKAKKWVKDLF